VIPPFGSDGNLPAGQHAATWAEVEERYGTSPHRRRLLDGLRRALISLRLAGCRTVYLDGSFVTAKAVPQDFDACREVDGVDPARLDPTLLTFENGRRAQKTAFGGEPFPAGVPADETGRVFLECFQVDRATGGPKGIIVLSLQDVP
jgi:hypothetical protein